MPSPDRIERTIDLAYPPERVWAAITTAEGLGTWLREADVDLRPGGEACPVRGSPHVHARDPCG